MQQETKEETVTLAELTGSVGFMMRMAQLRIFDDFARATERMHLRPSDYAVLKLIRGNPGCRASQIAEILFIKPPNFVTLLADLEERRLVTRQRSEGDKRVFQLTLTRYGKAFLKKADVLVSEHEQRFADLLGPEGTATLLDLLGHLTALREPRGGNRSNHAVDGGSPRPATINASSAKTPRS